MLHDNPPLLTRQSAGCNVMMMAWWMTSAGQCRQREPSGNSSPDDHQHDDREEPDVDQEVGTAPKENMSATCSCLRWSAGILSAIVMISRITAAARARPHH